jgi:transposase
MMRMTTVLNKVLAMQGLWVRGLELIAEAGELWLVVAPRWRISRCGGCGRKVWRRHDRTWRSWRHLDCLGQKTFLRYAIWRVRCRRCGVRTEQVPWAELGSRFTRAFEQQVAWLAQRTDLTAVAEYFQISWATVRNIVQRVVDSRWDGDRSLDGLRVIGVDEISYRRHHNYLTVVVDHLSGRVVWAGKDRKAKTLLRFFRHLGPERAAQLEAISCDMWEPYVTVLRRKAPQARIIFDRFHIVRHLNQAVTKVRQQLVRDADAQTRRALRHTRFPLLKSPQSRTPKDRQVLEEQVRGNRKLYRAMLLKDDFMDLYTYHREGWAKRFLQGWLRRAMYSKIEPIKKVARMIRNHLDGVLGWIQWQISNGRLEGMNNRIRLLSHRSFGLHSAEALISLVYLCCGGIELQPSHTK